jgi:imidazolonepropionase-like amidohydrolase
MMSEAPEVLRFYDDELSKTLKFMTRGGNNKYVRADRIEELELAVRYEADLAQMALDARKELEAKLAKAVEALDEAVYLLDPDEEDMMMKAGVYRVVTTLTELKM